MLLFVQCLAVVLIVRTIDLILVIQTHDQPEEFGYPKFYCNGYAQCSSFWQQNYHWLSPKEKWWQVYIYFIAKMKKREECIKLPLYTAWWSTLITSRSKLQSIFQFDKNYSYWKSFCMCTIHDRTLLTCNHNGIGTHTTATAGSWNIHLYWALKTMLEHGWSCYESYWPVNWIMNILKAISCELNYEYLKQIPIKLTFFSLTSHFWGSCLCSQVCLRFANNNGIKLFVWKF